MGHGPCRVWPDSPIVTLATSADAGGTVIGVRAPVGVHANGGSQHR